MTSSNQMTSSDDRNSSDLRSDQEGDVTSSDLTDVVDIIGDSREYEVSGDD